MRQKPEQVQKLIGWREQAASIVEELFALFSEEHWNDLLDLRQGLLEGQNWESVLDHFLLCRRKLEIEAYLPFYRLRNLLAASLTLEGAVEWEGLPSAPLEILFRRRHRSVQDWKRQLEREWFELSADLCQAPETPFSLVEYGS